MIWFHRFLLGLPCRQQDRLEINNNFPEVINEPGILERLVYSIFYRFPFESYTQLNEEFIKWYQNADISEGGSYSKDECPIENCPLKAAYRITENGEVILHMMRIGGFNKPPKSSFLELVRTVHKETENISRVILTDPYILLDCFEDRTRGGLQNLVDYLRTLRLTKQSNFELQINPSPKKHTDVLQNKFKESLEIEFPNIKIGHYKAKYKFHDRFYLAEDNSGNIKGVFGPSVNGLLSYSIVLFGELETDKTMTKLKDWFN